MKKTLFRGKVSTEIDNYDFIKNGWVYGQYIEAFQGFWRDFDKNGKDITPVYPAMFVTSINDDELTFQGYMYVKPESVGQYIGKKDKNGIEIFDGDILETSDGKHYCVYYNEREAAYHLRYFAGVVRGVYSNVVVVGNMTDNPELMEV